MPRNANAQKDKTLRTNTPPPIFGRGATDRILICLAVNGPMHLSGLAEAVDRSASSVVEILDRLIKAHLITPIPKTTRRIVALCPNLSLAQTLRTLLLTLSETWPVTVVDRSAPEPKQSSDHVVRPQLQHLDARSHRLDVLSVVAANRNVGIKAIAAELDITPTTVLNTINVLEHYALIHSTRVGLRRVLSLDPAFPAAVALERFLLDLWNARGGDT